MQNTMPSNNSNQDNDLPLMANVEDVHITHYVMQFQLVSINSKSFNCVVYIFVTLLTETKDFSCILDAKDIRVLSVRELLINHTELSELKALKTDQTLLGKLQEFNRKDLEFSVETWSVTITKRLDDDYGYPRIIQINYETTEEGESVKWTKDQNDRPCCFTPAAFINNRSLFPCQEPPSAMATWQCYVSVSADEEDLQVLVSGDYVGKSLKCGHTYYFFTEMILPMSTFALAIGFWVGTDLVTEESAIYYQQPIDKYQCDHEVYNCYLKRRKVLSIIPCRLYGTEEISQSALKELDDYIPRCMKAASHLLGPFPFSRLDIVIVPSSFSCLGLLSPNLLFLSQSMFCGDGSMLIRFAHELAHFWFGLLIGALDWTEEWLSEGFATFMEDVIHGTALEMSGDDIRRNSELRAEIRRRTLRAEMLNTESELQILRPKVPADEAGSIVHFVKNGMNANKLFTQVHYLKGYFLLRHLSRCVGADHFLTFLKNYVLKFHGKLVHSKDFFSFLLESFPDLTTDDSFHSKLDMFLDSTGFHADEMTSDVRTLGNSQLSEVDSVVKQWLSINTTSRNGVKRKKCSPDNLKMCSDQLVLVLEHLLEEECLSKTVLKAIRDTYDIAKRNADVRHRWCELVIKNHFASGLDDVRNFLLNDQAMGVYLYGELSLSSRAAHKKLARDCFKATETDMDVPTRKTVYEMLFGDQHL